MRGEVIFIALRSTWNAAQFSIMSNMRKQRQGIEPETHTCETLRSHLPCMTEQTKTSNISNRVYSWTPQRLTCAAIQLHHGLQSCIQVTGRDLFAFMSRSNKTSAQWFPQ